MFAAASKCILGGMANPPNLPTSPADKNWPKGPNFKGIVYGFALAILVVIVLAIILLSSSGRKLIPVHTKTTPSQTHLILPAAPWASASAAASRA